MNSDRLWICSRWSLDGTSATANVIDLYDIKEIVRRLSGNQFKEDDLRKIAEAVGICRIFFR